MTQQLYVRVDDPVPAFVPATLDDIRKAGYVPLSPGIDHTTQLSKTDSNVVL